MQFSPIKPTEWSDRLAFDVALTLEGSGESLSEVMERHDINADAMLRFNNDPVFLKKVDSYRTEIRDKGMTFKLKARAQAEELLTTSWLLIHDPAVSPSVKADLIKSTVKWAGLEPKGDEDGGQSTGGVKIMINLGNSERDRQIIDVKPRNEDEDADDSNELAALFQ